MAYKTLVDLGFGNRNIRTNFDRASYRSQREMEESIAWALGARDALLWAIEGHLDEDVHSIDKLSDWDMASLPKLSFRPLQLTISNRRNERVLDIDVFNSPSTGFVNVHVIWRHRESIVMPKSKFKECIQHQVDDWMRWLDGAEK